MLRPNTSIAEQVYKAFDFALFYAVIYFFNLLYKHFTVYVTKINFG